MARTNAEILASFKNDGFVPFPQFVCGDELCDLIRQVDRFIRDLVPNLPGSQVFYEDTKDDSTLKQIQQMGDHDPWFRDLFTAGRFRQVAEMLLNGPVFPKNLQYFNKPSGIGQPTPAHQDGYYFMLDPCEAVTMWFALEDVDEENGCIRYVKGSHRRGMRKHARTDTLGFSQGIEDFPTSEDTEFEVTCPAKAGDLFVHDALTIHRAEGNRSSTRTRRALGFVYFSERSCENKEAQAAYQRRLVNEMKAAGKI